MFTLCNDTTGQKERETFNHSKVSIQEDRVELVVLGGLDKELWWKGQMQREKLLGMVPNFS